MEQKQTAVEWLVEQIIKKHPIITQYLPNYNFDKEIIQQAKEIEKQQIMQAVYDAMGTNFDPNMGRAEQYYNEEYGK